MITTKFAGMTAFSLLIVIFQQNSYAQLDDNGGFSLKGNGFALSEDAVISTNIDLLLTTVEKNAKRDIIFQNGVIGMNGKDLELSDLSGTILGDDRFFIMQAKASDFYEDFSVNIVGKLLNKGSVDSIYSLTGTLKGEGQIAKISYITKASEVTEEPETEKSQKEITIRILEDSANPEKRTYNGQVGLRFKYFSQSMITIEPNTTITFVNDDTASHTLVSGTASNSRHKPFIPDGKISSDQILAGKSWSVTYDEPGFYRLFDPKYRWMTTTIFVSPESDSIILSSKSLKPDF